VQFGVGDAPLGAVFEVFWDAIEAPVDGGNQIEVKERPVVVQPIPGKGVVEGAWQPRFGIGVKPPPCRIVFACSTGGKDGVRSGELFSWDTEFYCLVRSWSTDGRLNKDGRPLTVQSLPAP
jgi:hypothetical protein